MDNKVVIAVTFCFNHHVLEWWTSKNAKEPEWVGTLTWVGFKELFVVRFAPKYQELGK